MTWTLCSSPMTGDILDDLSGWSLCIGLCIGLWLSRRKNPVFLVCANLVISGLRVFSMGSHFDSFGFFLCFFKLYLITVYVLGLVSVSSSRPHSTLWPHVKAIHCIYGAAQHLMYFYTYTRAYPNHRNSFHFHLPHA